MKKIRLIAILFAIMSTISVVNSASIISIQTLCSGKSSEVEITSLPTGSKIYESVQIDCPVHKDSAIVTLDGTVLASYTNSIKYLWQPQKLGNNKLVYTSGNTSLTTTVNVVEFDYFVPPSPKPPMSKDTKISITPTTRNFEVSGGGGAIVTSGSGTWTAAVSDSWISLSSTSGSAGYPVAYAIGANTNIEERVGYVYVSGYTHTVWQAGIGAEVNKTYKEFEHKGGSDTITVLAQNKILWQARPNCDWISVKPVSGMGENFITYTVAPFNEVTTREGTITVAGNTITIFQYGRRIELDSYSLNVDWYTHVIPIKVNALAISSWSVTPNASWISIVDAGSGKGGDTVTIAVSENPSYKSRKGTVTIGTETFTITQDGRTDLVFTINPEKSTASVEGATGLIAVNATPDLPWSASCNVNWVTILEGFKSGSGTGNIVYTASPNPTLNSRTGKVTVAPDSASGMPSRTHTVTQPAATSSISKSSYEFKASGENCTVNVSVSDIVEWTISESLDWITIGGSTSRVGPGSVVISASANESVYPRSGTVTIAKKTFKVSQKGRGVEIEYETKLFGTDGGLESISVHPDGNVSWTAIASDPTWITIYQGSTGQGDGEVLYIISPYTGNGESRTGWITIGDKKVYITQRPYDLTIEPNGTVVSGNNGAGEFGVSASIDDVWNAIVTEPWITIVSGYDSGTGNGVVRFVYTENDTGITRTGKIIVSGEIYTIEQAARVLVEINATAEYGGKVSGAGSYSIGSDVVLTAIPDAGYSFSYWEGDISSMQNPLTIKVDAEKSVNAVFEPLPIAFDSVVSSVDGVSLSWNNLAWATNYTIYRGITSVPSSAEILVELENTGNCSYLDTTGEVGETYWYWIEANGAVDSVMSEPMTGKKEKPIIISSITYENLRGATHSNPTTYQEGTLVIFTYPESIIGYTFAGWNPQQISADMIGDQIVSATWTANKYEISYNANGGSGEMTSTSAIYDVDTEIAENGFTFAGHIFKGWSTSVDGTVEYSPNQNVKNLTSMQNGVVVLYAVWKAETYAVTFNANGGEGTMSSQTYTYGVEQALTANAFTREGYTFAGWATSVDGVVAYTADQSISITAPLALYAVWKANTYAVSFNANGGEGIMSSQTYTYGVEQALTANAFTREGYNFAGWATSADGAVVYTAGQSISVSTSMTLYAVWEANIYAVSFSANGGEGTMPAQTFTHGVEQALTANAFTREGYTFAGWATSADGAVVYTAGQNISITAPMTLYAVWKVSFVPAPVISPVDGSEFIGETCEVTISCSLSEAVIYYSTNGATPRPTEANRYKGAFNITDTTTIKAFALFDGIKSTYSSVVITKRGLTLAEAVGAKDLVFTTGGDAEWIPVVDETTANGYCAESGAIGLESVTWMETSVTGSGTFSFDWMVDCEEDDSGDCTWDRAIVYTNDVEVARIDGITEWETITFNFTDNAEHIITWEFVKDDYDEEYADYLDAAWVSNVSWKPEAVIEVIPEITDDSEIASALEGSKDAKLLENITSIDEYNAYRAWAKNLSRTSLQDVKDCPFAWLSYALDTDQLIVKEPAQGDLHITAFAPTVAGDSFNMSISLDNINVGTNAKAENLAKLFTIKGNNTLEVSNFSSEKVNVIYSVPSNGNINVLVAPREDSHESFFIQVVFHLIKTQEEYTVTFNANGATGTMPAQTFTHGVEQSLSANAFTREGHTFAGWATSADGVVAYIARQSISISASMTLYAVWEANTYAVSFNANGGEGTMPSQTFTHGVEQALSANAFTHDGYTFAGWATSVDGAVAYTAAQSISITAPMTLYAVWQQATEITDTYLVIDLSGGTSSASYPVTELSDVPAGGWTDEYKTTKLVLRKITAGKMPRTDVDITLTKDYYVGVFEVTQKQWELVNGTNPSRLKGDTLPVENVSYNNIRGSSNGSQWPASNAVDATSFMGKLRAKTGIDFDLPTGAQWEYACRAGSSGDYGLLADGTIGTIDQMGWYDENSGGITHIVGAKTPNAWGLYDMHGNVWEWCLDGDSDDRIIRGGSCDFDAEECEAGFRYSVNPDDWFYSLGFRLATSGTVK